MQPGARTFTRKPWSAKSSAIARTIPIMPALAPQQATRPYCPTGPYIEAIAIPRAAAGRAKHLRLQDHESG